MAMIRLLKPISYYKEKYGTELYGLDRLYLIMEKEHNRGQEAAGIGCVKLNVEPGNEYIFRERGPKAPELFLKYSPPCTTGLKRNSKMA